MLRRRLLLLLVAGALFGGCTAASTASAYLPHWGGGKEIKHVRTEWFIIELEEISPRRFVVLGCYGGTDVATVFGSTPRVNGDSFAWTGCHAPNLGGVPCTSKGAASGEIKSKPLKGELGVINEKANEVGLRLAGKSIAKFQCGTHKEELRGGMIAPISPINRLVSPEEEFTLHYVANEGGQAVTRFEGGPLTQLELGVDKGALNPVALSGVDTVKFDTSTEIVAR